MNLPMKSIRPALCSPIAALLLAGTSPDATIAFGPDEGTTLTKRFENRGTYDLEDLAFTVDGQDMSVLFGVLELSIDYRSGIALTDVYEKMAEGRPARLLRTYDEVTGGMEVSAGADGDSESEDMDLSCELEGVTVLFELDEESGEYTLSYHEGDGEDEWLEDLEEDTDLRFLLPDGEVSDGDTWDVEVSAFGQLLNPGGELPVEFDGLESDDGDDMSDVFGQIGDGASDKLEELFSGECTATLVGVEEGVASIAIELEIASAVDLTDVMEELMASIGEESGEEMPIVFDIADMNLDVEAEGTLLWDLEAGHAVSLTIGSDGVMGFDMAASAEMMDESSSVEAAVEFAFSMASEVVIE